MKIYCAQNARGRWKASKTYKKISRKLNNFMVTEIDDYLVHDKVYLVEIYYGFDYNYDSMVNPIYNVIGHSNRVYYSINSLKMNDEIWKKYEKIAKEDPEHYHITDFSIASDYGGQPFEYGDVMEDKFNMRIINLKLL